MHPGFTHGPLLSCIGPLENASPPRARGYFRRGQVARAHTHTAGVPGRHVPLGDVRGGWVGASGRMRVRVGVVVVPTDTARQLDGALLMRSCGWAGLPRARGGRSAACARWGVPRLSPAHSSGGAGWRAADLRPRRRTLPRRAAGSSVCF